MTTLNPPTPPMQEYTLDVDSELRFEIETKNEKVIVEVGIWNELIILKKRLQKYVIINSLKYLFTFS